MGRNRRVVFDESVNFEDDGFEWVPEERVVYEFDGAGSASDFVEFGLTFPIAFGGTVYTNATIWATGFFSFGPATDEQIAFVNAFTPQTNPLLFPGDFVLVPRSSPAISLIVYAQIRDTVQSDNRDLADDLLYIGWSNQPFSVGDFQPINSTNFALSNNNVTIPAGASFRLGSSQGANLAAGVTVATAGSANIGSAGADLVEGFASNDFLNGGAGNDILRGYGGNDILLGGSGNDTLGGGGGDDLIRPGMGFDTVNGGAGIDTVSYEFDGGRVQVNLSTGQGFASAADGDTYAGIENAIGGPLADSLIGNDVANRLESRAGDDELFGFGGDDFLMPGLGVDIVNGGTGIDTVSYADDFGPVQVNLRTGRGFASTAEGDTYAGIENAVGSVFNDSLIGDDIANRFTGRAGNDELFGFGGDDVLIGGLGADRLDGGDGVDTVSYEDNEGQVFADLLRGIGASNAAQGDTFFGIENVLGSIFGDYIIGSDGANTLDGGAGNDILIGALGADVLIGGEGIDTVSYEDQQGAVTIDLFRSRGHGNAAEGDSYAGIENGTGTLFNDTLIGNDAANVLAGGRGADLLIGLGGADTFVFDTAPGSGNVDQIADFTAADDTIQLAAGVFGAIAPGALSAAAFTTGAAATTAAHRIVYDSQTGEIFYDADGSGDGAAVLFATVTAGTAVTAADFVVV